MNILQDGIAQLQRVQRHIVELQDSRQQVIHRCRHCQTPVEIRASRNGNGYFAFHPFGRCVASERFRHQLGPTVAEALEALNA